MLSAPLRATVALLLFSAATGLAQAQDIDPMAAETFMVMNGRCTAAKVGGRDLTRGCEGVLAAANFPPDRVQFSWTFSNGAVISVTGTDRPNPSPDIDELRVVRLFLNLGIEGVPSTGGPASGRCRFGNPFAGVAKVDCQGKQNGKPFSLQFVSNGQPPR